VRPASNGLRCSRTLASALATLAIAAAAAGCGSDSSGESSSPNISIPAVTAPTATSPSFHQTTTSSGATTTGKGGKTYNPTAPDSATNDVPPPSGSPQAQFEQQCKQNPSACG
jgi:hypothetical protein